MQASKMPACTWLHWHENSHRWELIDRQNTVLSDGTATSQRQARSLAWGALEEMGLVTDE